MITRGRTQRRPSFGPLSRSCERDHMYKDGVTGWRPARRTSWLAWGRPQVRSAGERRLQIAWHRRSDRRRVVSRGDGFQNEVRYYCVLPWIENASYVRHSSNTNPPTRLTPTGPGARTVAEAADAAGVVAVGVTSEFRAFTLAIPGACTLLLPATAPAVPAPGGETVCWLSSGREKSWSRPIFDAIASTARSEGFWDRELALLCATGGFSGGVLGLSGCPGGLLGT
jgi:hypothetical protein